MGRAEAEKLMPFIRAGAKKRISRFMKMANRVDIIPEIYVNSETEESRKWKEELNIWRNKLKKLGFKIKGNESINELEQIYARIKRINTSET